MLRAGEAAAREAADEPSRCACLKADGTRCPRPVADAELRACKLHLHTARRQRELVRAVEADSPARDRNAEIERREAADMEGGVDLLKPSPLGFAKETSGIGMAMSDGPTFQHAVARATESIEMVESLATIRGGSSRSKERNALELDERAKEDLEACPVCLCETANIELQPCQHRLCGSCLDQWRSERSSFAQTLRNGSSETTCPLCRAIVQTTKVAIISSTSPVEMNQLLLPARPRSAGQVHGESRMDTLRPPAASSLVGKAPAATSKAGLAQPILHVASSNSSWTDPDTSNGEPSMNLWGQGNLVPFFGTHECESISFEALDERPSGDRLSCTIEAIESGLEAVMCDEDEDEADVGSDVPDAMAHLGQDQGERDPAELIRTHVSSSIASADTPTQHSVGSSPANERHRGPVTTGADGWNSLSGGGAFGMLPWGQLAVRSARTAPDRGLPSDQIQAEFRSLREELDIAQGCAAEYLQRAEKAEKESRWLAEQMNSLKQELQLLRATHHAREEAHNELRAEFESLSRLHESTCANTRVMRAQLEAQKSELREHRQFRGQFALQNAPASNVAAPATMHMWERKPHLPLAHPPSVMQAAGGKHVWPAPAIWNGTAPQLSTCAASSSPGPSSDSHLPETVRFPSLTHVVQRHALHSSMGITPDQINQKRQDSKLPKEQVPHFEQGMPTASGLGASTEVPTTPWKCAHCTYLNQSPAILDPMSRRYKGFCEMCEGVTNLG